MAWPGSNIVVGNLGFEAPYGYSYGSGGLGYKSRRSARGRGTSRTYRPGQVAVPRTRKSMRRRRGF